MPIGKQQGTKGILQQARLDLCVVDQALPQPMELSRWQLPFSAGINACWLFSSVSHGLNDWYKAYVKLGTQLSHVH